MVDYSMLEWARAQFAMTALFHFFFVPFTLGMSFIVAFFETIYVKTGKAEWKEITQFWQLIFGINFAIGLSTGIIHEFEFGTNWSTYSWVVGDLFGAPLAVEGIVAFFLEATFAAIAFFGWKRVSKGVHLTSSWLLAIGSNLSALWILIANGFMQHPTSEFYKYNIDNARLEMTDFFAMITQPVAQVKFLHVVSSAYTLAAVFVLGISSLYLLRGKHKDFAKKSATVAAAFGLVASIFTAVIGDEHAYEVANTQPTKIAAAEGLIVGEKGAPIVAIGIPKTVDPRNTNSNDEAFAFKIELPGMLSLLGKRDINAFVPGLKDLVNGNEKYGIWPFEKLHAEGAKAIEALKAYHTAKANGDKAGMEAAKAEFYKVVADVNGVKVTRADLMGYGYLTDPTKLYPPVAPVFYSFHIMVALGFWFILLFLLAYVSILKGTFENNTLVQKLAVLSVPLPWIGTSFGWMTAEIGRQPWTVFGVLPTSESVTPIALQNVQATFFLFLTAFVILGIAELKILFTVVKHGPKGAH
ncbi:cytochrome D ubiquinol oxidase subunit I [Nautilia profundicola AmH]|uniref:Cytochrome D ubiquinol oxidase subunit I n=1 Tax=Nautilia profundicola (strain ATCC BAA-1463 / DSM 18972 / AmH) TaxID=598659 RepID=B9L7C2_NAUPA|nr:cytochrome ubiquinol oxidase subunit I [Nautilia profundicola]ACM93524.1 cytochrome D ubiquinol oxidase subunit I [Nautilia profundicola AmH]